MIRFEDLLEKVRAYSPDADVELLRRAYVFSAFEHRGQVRHSGEPYLIHPLAVADFLADMKLDAVAVAAGMLHDVVEDTLTTIDRIRELFGPEVAHVVQGVTKISAIRFSSSEERQAENFRKMLLAMVDDIRVILVKLADRLHNMRTLGHLIEDRRVKIAQETRDIYAPIANRLGMSKVKNELEELSFRYLEPQAYEALRTEVDLKRRATEGLIGELKKTITAKLTEAQVPVVEIDGRIKRLWSIHQKLERQKIDLGQVYDFIALRIITNDVKDCYAALGIIHQTWSPVPGRIKDFIAMPRPNGYQSLHTSVISEHGMPFEVQIRTMEQHRRAEEGIAAHWKYKEGRGGDKRAVELGRKLFEKEARRYDLNPKTIVEGEAFAKALTDFAVGKTDDLFAAIGYGKIQPKQVLVRLVPADSLREKPPEGAVASVVRRVLGSGEEKIKVKGFDDLMVFRARCCSPIRGEKIVGYVTRGKGVSVHSATCPNVVNLLYDPERRIDVEWDKSDAVARYTVKLTMEVEDRKGLLAAVSAKIAGINTNIKNMEARTGDDQHARIDVTIEISDLKHLEKVIKSLRGVEGVIGVERAGRATAT